MNIYNEFRKTAINRYSKTALVMMNDEGETKEYTFGQTLQQADILNTKIEPEAAKLLAERSRLTPRIANRLLKRVRDYADVNGDGIIDVPTTEAALKMLEIDELGLDPADRNMLTLIYEKYGDRPVGLNTIAALTGDEQSTIEDYYEPFLMQLGMLQRTPRGRVVTDIAKRHLGF